MSYLYEKCISKKEIIKFKDGKRTIVPKGTRGKIVATYICRTPEKYEYEVKFDEFDEKFDVVKGEIEKFNPMQHTTNLNSF